MTTYNNAKSVVEVLRRTNNGRFTIIVFNKDAITGLKKKHFEIIQNLEMFSLTIKNEAPATVIQAKDFATYMILVAVLDKKSYKVLESTGQLSEPAKSMATT